MRIVCSGGGTGGHVFPAIAIADEIKRNNPSAVILFIGAKGKIEMDKVPKAGYPIEGLKIRGFYRKMTLSNISKNIINLVGMPYNLLKARNIIKRFDPDVVVGVGGYASGPALAVASRMGIPTLIQEQNSFPGKTNRMLAKTADKICVAYPNMERYFPKEKIVFTGNPVRKNILEKGKNQKEARKHFGLNPDIKTILVFGGSLGARSLNEAMRIASKSWMNNDDVQVLWQVGKLYYEEFKKIPAANAKNIKIVAFIDDMPKAYAAADLAICRAGAMTIAELSIVGKPVILVPSPNVAEDHQTMNARQVADLGGGVHLPDNEASEKLYQIANELLSNKEKRSELGKNIKKLASENAAEKVVAQIIKLYKKQ